MPQLLRPLSALPKDLGSDPNTHIGASTTTPISVPGVLIPSDFQGHLPLCGAYTHK